MSADPSSESKKTAVDSSNTAENATPLASAQQQEPASSSGARPTLEGASLGSPLAEASDPRLPNAGSLEAVTRQLSHSPTADNAVHTFEKADFDFRASRAPGDGQESTGAPPPPAYSSISGGGQQRRSRSSSRQNWQPDADLLPAIQQLGFSRAAAERALFYTSNRSADEAVGWLLDHPQVADDSRPLDQEGDSSSDSESDLAQEYHDMLAQASTAYKMALVVNGQLKMGVGKTAAQCGHATLGLYRKLLCAGDNASAALSTWDALGETKVVLKADDDAQLAKIQSECGTRALPHYLVRDAGRTQIAAGSQTVLSVFGPVAAVDAVTGQLAAL